MGNTHMIAGALAASAVLHVTGAPPPQIVPGLILGATAGLLPDLDLPGSVAARAIPGYRLVFNGGMTTLLVAVAAALWAVPRYTTTAVIAPDWWMFPAAAAFCTAVVSFFLREVLSHRVQTHSLLATTAFAGAIHWLWPAAPDALWWSLVAGYASHLFVDLFNPEGAALLWPLSHRKWSVADSLLLVLLRPVVVVTGGLGEEALWRPSITILLVASVLWHAIKLFKGGGIHG